MPELPEVETIKNQLNPFFPLKIVSCKKSEHLETLIKSKKKSSLKKLTMNSISRFGKYLIIKLSDDLYFISHLGMSGSWRINSDTKIPHTHLYLKGQSPQGEVSLSYVDPRRFGRMYFLDKKELDLFISQRGLDITHTEFTSQKLFQLLKRYPNRFLKATLLDQRLFAGIGNYMASEICALAKIHPLKKCADINQRQATRLHLAVKDLLNQTFKAKGTTFQGGYRDAYGEKGEGVLNLVVFYQKTCQQCLKTPVEKIMLQGRGTYFCPKCQGRP